MEKGGNERWRRFWESSTGEAWGYPGKGGDRAAAGRLEKVYGGEKGEEWKERLGCEVEGREFVGMPVREKKKMEGRGMGGDSAAAAAVGVPVGIGGRSQKEMNEDFFARKGGENEGRPEGVAPSQGGKYGGFGSEPPAAAPGESGAIPGVDDFQKDPVAALSKGFGWFTKAVGTGAKSVNEGWIQPTAAKVQCFLPPELRQAFWNHVEGTICANSMRGQ